MSETDRETGLNGDLSDQYYFQRKDGQTMKTIVIGLGNTLLSDDGVGIYAARRLRRQIEGKADVIEAETAGFDIMEIMNGYDRALIIDSIQLDGVEPGTVFRISPGEIKTTPRLASFHDIDLITALTLGSKIGLHMPGEVIIFAVQGKDVLTLREGLLKEVESVVPKLVDEIAGTVRDTEYERISIDLKDR